MRRRRSKVSTDRDHFETIDVGNPFSMFQIDSNSTSIQSNCISHDYNDCYNWMPAIRHCGLVYLCHTRIDQHVVVVFRDSGSTVAAVVSHCLKSSSVSMRSFTEFRSHSERWSDNKISEGVNDGLWKKHPRHPLVFQNSEASTILARVSFQLHKPVSFAIRICLVLLYFGKLQLKWTGCSVFVTSVQIILSSPLRMFLATLARIASLHLKSHDSRSQTQLNICWVRFNSNVRSH